MKYSVKVGEPPRTVEVEVTAEGVKVDGKPVEARMVAIPGTPLYHLLLGVQSWTVAVQAVEDGRWTMGVAGERVAVEAMDERTRQIRALAGARPVPKASGAVVAPMPGLVVRVLVVAGQQVEAGEGLVVVEAMKMENELRAARAGVVAKVHVDVGQVVEKGAPLVTLGEPETKV